MPFTNAARNNMLAAIGVTHASLHSAFPGTTGLNEISGGTPAYARRAVTFNAAVSGSRGQNGTAVFDVPAAAAVQHVGFWTASTGGTFLGSHPLGGAPAREFVTDLAGDLIRSNAHGLSNGQQIVFVGDTVQGGLTEGTIYFVISATADTLQVAATSGGAAIDLTSQAGNGCQLIRIVPEDFGSQGTLTLSAATLSLLL